MTNDDAPPPGETPRERFLRNHQENVGIMRAARVKAEREGRLDDAESIGVIVEAWEGIAEKAKGDRP